MRSGRFNISRGNQLGDGIASAPRLLLVPREEPKPQPAPVPVAQLGPPPVVTPAAPVSPEYQPVHDRLSALERLDRLRDEGALTAREYSAEKAKLLRPPAEELVLSETAPRNGAGPLPAANGSASTPKVDGNAAPPPFVPANGAESPAVAPAAELATPLMLRTAQGPALLDRIAIWKVVMLGLLAGLALSYASQPRETVRFLEDLVKLFAG